MLTTRQVVWLSCVLCIVCSTFMLALARTQTRSPRRASLHSETQQQQQRTARPMHNTRLRTNSPAVGGNQGPSCSSVQCGNGATCVDEEAGFFCQCAPGYEGLLCEYADFPQADWMYNGLRLEFNVSDIFNYDPAEKILIVDELSTILLFGQANSGKKLSAGNFSVQTNRGQSWLMSMTLDGTVTGLSLLPCDGSTDHIFVTTGVLRVGGVIEQNEGAAVLRVVVGEYDFKRYAARIAMLNITVPTASGQTTPLSVIEEWVTLGYPGDGQNVVPKTEQLVLSNDGKTLFVSGVFPCKDGSCSFEIGSKEHYFSFMSPEIGYFLASLNVQTGVVQWAIVDGGLVGSTSLSALSSQQGGALMWALSSGEPASYLYPNDTTQTKMIMVDQQTGKVLSTLTQKSVHVESLIEQASEHRVLMVITVFLPAQINGQSLPADMAGHPRIPQRTALTAVSVAQQEDNTADAVSQQQQAAPVLDFSLIKVLDPEVLIPINPFGPWSALEWSPKKDSLLLLTSGWAHYSDYGTDEWTEWNGPALLAQLSLNGDIMQMTRAVRSTIHVHAASQGQALAVSANGLVVVSGNYWGCNWKWSGHELTVSDPKTERNFIAAYHNPFREF